MPVDIIIPSPGESITEVTIGTWHKRPGEWVEKDEPVVEIESDKATLEIPAPESGALNILLDKGSEAKVGARVGTVDPSAKKPEKQGAAAASKSPAGDAASVVERATESAAAEGRATSVARKIAAERGVDLARVQGTGPSGRIRKADVLAISDQARQGGAGIAPAKDDGSRASQRGGAVVPARQVVAISGAGHRGVRREKMTKLRQRIAERLVQAQRNAAMLTTFNEADMGEVMRLRSQHKDEFEKRHGIGLGFMSFFVKACVSALQAFPRVNAYIVGDEIEYHDFVDMSIAVGTDKGLVVPVLRNAEQMSFADIEGTIRDLATRARDGKLTIEEMTGGTFTITNGGVYGSLNSTPILNPPQSGILGMHAIKKRPIEFPANSGQIALRPMMYLALSYDHRIVDGAEAVSFLVHVKNMLENPERMLLGV
jgi:2-oxoglutarate dehydrogenase E2 component (dihydrolipoamide succinyltransferase)